MRRACEFPVLKIVSFKTGKPTIRLTVIYSLRNAITWFQQLALTVLFCWFPAKWLISQT